MSPATSEEELEKELESVVSELQSACYEISCIRKRLDTSETEYLFLKIKAERIIEQLRRFRAMYPSLCLETKED